MLHSNRQQRLCLFAQGHVLNEDHSRLVTQGKAGGMTIRNNLAPKECKDMDTWDNPQTKREIWLKARCSHVKEMGTRLSLQTRDVFHLSGYNETAVKEATSFIVTLRNPIDRIVSGLWSLLSWFRTLQRHFSPNSSLSTYAGSLSSIQIQVNHRSLSIYYVRW